jgi:hypothetical protein
MMVAAISVLVGVIEPWRAVAAACAGDCDGGGAVTINELLMGVNMALGSVPVSGCPSFDRNRDGVVTIDELLDAVRAALVGCPIATPTPTPLNEPPRLSPVPVYRTYPGFPIRFPITASDPEGGLLHYQAANLPDGAALDDGTGVFSWTPRDDQLGPFYIPFSITDEGQPPQSAAGRLAVQVALLDPCTEPTCTPESGCAAALAPLDTPCCDSEPVVRLSEAQADCPAGGVLLVGRNTEGFGALQNCDRVPVVPFAQGGTAVRLNVAARCVNASAPVTVALRLEMQDRVLIDRQQTVTLQAQDSGYAEARLVSFAISGAVRFLDLEGQEADLDMMLTDESGLVVQTRRRLVLTAQELPNLPEVNFY